MRKLLQREHLLFAITITALAYVLLMVDRTDKLDKAMRKLGGANAVSCGTTYSESHRPSVFKCSINSFKEGKPFFYRHNNGKNSGSAGWVMTPKGAFYFLSYTPGFWLSSGRLSVSRGYKPAVTTFRSGWREIKCERIIKLSAAEQAVLLKP